MKRGKGLSRGSKELSRGSKELSRGTKMLRTRKGLSVSKKVRQKSDKQLGINEDLHEVYRQMAEEEDIFCTGCGTTSTLSHSHLVPRSKRSDLTAVRENITWHCFRCHDIWEHGTLEQLMAMNDFEKNMRYVWEVDLDYYNLITLNR